MKGIDLLNKIANDEEVPEYVKYKNHHSLDIEDTMMVCKENLFYKLEQFEIYLNDEVKIIEDKELQKLSYQQVGYQNCDGSERKIKEVVIDFNKQVKQLGNKLNEVIEVVKELKKEGK